jgi:hypothetical protein
MKRWIYLLFFAMSCGEIKEPPADKTSTVFSYYLKEAFRDSIKQEKETYILIPKVGCKGCREDALNVLQQEAKKSGIKKLTFIISPTVTLPENFSQSAIVLVDNSDLIDRINLPVSNIAILKTEKGRVISLVSIRSETTDSIGYFLRK